MPLHLAVRKDQFSGVAWMKARMLKKGRLQYVFANGSDEGVAGMGNVG